MIFDKFCGIVEKHFPNLRGIVEEAKVFDFPEVPHEVLPKGVDIDFFEEHFFLPFQVVAIEDKASMIILVDDTPDSIGLYTKRLFIECLPMKSDWRFYGDSAGYPDFIKEKISDIANTYEGHYIVSIGTIQLKKSGTSNVGYNAEGMLSSCLLCSKESVVSFFDFDPSKEDCQKLADSALRNACTAIEEVMYFNTPNRFILEQSPISIKKSHKSSKRILRSSDRPIYTLLKPKEITKKLGIDTRSGKTTLSHPRRRHYRTLRSEKFVYKQHSVVVVKATWVGKDEVVRGGKRYKVMLDL